MVLKIISDAAVHSHATAFTLSSSQTEPEKLSKVLTVQQMSQLCPVFIAPKVLPLPSVHQLSCWSLCFHFHICSRDQFFGKTNKTCIWTKLRWNFSCFFAKLIRKYRISTYFPQRYSCCARSFLVRAPKSASRVLSWCRPLCVHLYRNPLRRCVYHGMLGLPTWLS